METKLRLACMIGCLMISASTLLVAGCGEDAAKEHTGASGSAGDAAGGAGAGQVGKGDAGKDSGVDAGGTDSGRGGRNDGEGGTENSGARPNVDPGGPNIHDLPDQPGAGGADAGEDSLDFDGVDLSDVSDVAPSGCVGGFDPVAGTLTIVIGGEAPVVRLAVHAGVVQANGVDCESGAGEPAKADEVLSLAITGGAQADALYLDLSDGAFSGCFSDAGAISVALGAGGDRVTVLGTNEADVIHAGSEAGRVVVDLTGDDRVDLTISDHPALVLSTGAKGDEVHADGAALGVDALEQPLSVYGGGGRDRLRGGAAADHLFGGIGNDWFDAGAAPAGADTFDGGAGNDTVDFSARTRALVISMGAGADDGESGENTDVTATVETLYAGQGTNDIVGSQSANLIWGGPLADTLAGGDGDDILVGGRGDDTISGERGDDYLYGDEGNDVLDGGAGDDFLDGFSGQNTLKGGAGDGDICFATPSDQVSGCEL